MELKTLPERYYVHDHPHVLQNCVEYELNDHMMVGQDTETAEYLLFYSQSYEGVTNLGNGYYRVDLKYILAVIKGRAITCFDPGDLIVETNRNYHATKVLSADGHLKEIT
jgi:hypothetical protein